MRMRGASPGFDGLSPGLVFSQKKSGALKVVAVTVVSDKEDAAYPSGRNPLDDPTSRLKGAV